MNNNNNSASVSFIGLRNMVGILGLILPFVLLLGNYILGCHSIVPSISDTYYSRMGDVFVGVMFCIGIFFFNDDGYDTHDAITLKIAGVCAVLIALFPCNCNAHFDCVTRMLSDSKIRNDIHYTSATIFFLDLAYILLFRFTKSNTYNITSMKKERNGVYGLSGIIIIASVICIACGCNVLFFECTSLVPFGISWIIKGGGLLKDK